MSSQKKKPAPPLKSIFTSVPFLALVIVHLGQAWGTYTIMNGMPTYLANIHHITLRNVFVESAFYVLLYVSLKMVS